MELTGKLCYIYLSGDAFMKKLVNRLYEDRNCCWTSLTVVNAKFANLRSKVASLKKKHEGGGWRVVDRMDELEQYHRKTEFQSTGDWTTLMIMWWSCAEMILPLVGPNVSGSSSWDYYQIFQLQDREQYGTESFYECWVDDPGKSHKEEIGAVPPDCWATLIEEHSRILWNNKVGVRGTATRLSDLV